MSGGVERFVLADPPAVAAAAAERFVRAATGSLTERGAFHVALAGGSTPRSVHQLLATPPLSSRVDWSRVHIWFGDERCVPPEHADSNYGMAKATLLDRVPIPSAQVHRMRGEDEPQAAAAAYADELVPVLDFAFLGMGPDGHTASLFPGTTAPLEKRARVVAVYVEKMKSWRVTLTAPVLSAAREVVITTYGAEKAEALALAIEGPPGSVPVQLIQPPRLAWIVDRAAAARLTR